LPSPPGEKKGKPDKVYFLLNLDGGGGIGKEWKWGRRDQGKKGCPKEKGGIQGKKKEKSSLGKKTKPERASTPYTSITGGKGRRGDPFEALNGGKKGKSGA